MFEVLKNGMLFIASRFLTILLVTALLLAAGVFRQYLAEHETEIRQMQQTLAELERVILQKGDVGKKLHHQVLRKQRSVQLKELELEEIGVTDYVQAPVKSAERAAELKAMIRLERIQLDFLIKSRENFLKEQDHLLEQQKQCKDALENAISSGKYQIIEEWKEKGIFLLGWVAFAVLVIPFLFPFIQYFVLFPLLEKIQRDKTENNFAAGNRNALLCTRNNIKAEGYRTVAIDLAAGEKLFVRTKGGDWGRVRQNLKTTR